MSFPSSVASKRPGYEGRSKDSSISKLGNLIGKPQKREPEEPAHEPRQRTSDRRKPPLQIEGGRMTSQDAVQLRARGGAPEETIDLSDDGQPNGVTPGDGTPGLPPRRALAAAAPAAAKIVDRPVVNIFDDEGDARKQRSAHRSVHEYDNVVLEVESDDEDPIQQSLIKRQRGREQEEREKRAVAATSRRTDLPNDLEKGADFYRCSSHVPLKRGHCGVCPAKSSWPRSRDARTTCRMSERLPPGWLTGVDAKYGAPYYYNTALNITQWYHPTVGTATVGTATVGPVTPSTATASKRSRALADEQAEAMEVAERAPAKHNKLDDLALAMCAAAEAIANDTCPAGSSCSKKFNLAHLSNKTDNLHRSWRAQNPKLHQLLKDHDQSLKKPKSVASQPIMQLRRLVLEAKGRGQSAAAAAARAEEAALLVKAQKRAEEEQEARRKQAKAMELAEQKLSETIESFAPRCSALCNRADSDGKARESALDTVKFLLTNRLIDYFLDMDDTTRVICLISIPASAETGVDVVSRDVTDVFPTLANLRLGGFSAAEFKLAGLSDPAILRVSGYTFSEVKNSYPLCQCRLAGFSTAEAREVGCTLAECHGAGFDWKDLAAAGFSNEEFDGAVRLLKVAELKQGLEARGLVSSGIKAALGGIKAALVERMLSAPRADYVPPNLRARDLVDEEVQQDVQAAALSEEVVQLRAKLEAEKQAHAEEVAEQAAKMEPLLAAARARQEASGRERAAALQASEGASSLGFASEAVDADAFFARFARDLVDEEVQQDVQAAALSEEVVQLRAKLEAEKQAHAEEVAEQAAKVEPLLAAARARQEASGRERAAALQASEGASSLGFASEAVDADAFFARFVAFRQHVEMLLKYVPTKASRTKPWHMIVRRDALCSTVLEHFQAGKDTKMHLFQTTDVTFVDATGSEEEGHDLGGLTVEMYSCFFREVLLADAGLFKGVTDDSGEGSISIGLLPSPNASPEAMAAMGRILCKCVLDDQPLGRGLGRFVFEYLADTQERRIFKSPQAALVALADYDADLAQRWAKLLAEPVEGLALYLFDPEAVDDDTVLPATVEAIGGAIIAGCRHRLLTSRECSLKALRSGFTEHVDLRIQLGALSSEELMLMLRGNTELSTNDLLECIEWPQHSPHAAEEAGFAAIGSEVPRYLREIIEDISPETAMTSEQRLHLLEWATALTALPCGGLKDRIILKLYTQADEHDLPNVHTCTHEVHLPAYSSREQLREKLTRAVEHRHDGFHIE